MGEQQATDEPGLQRISQTKPVNCTGESVRRSDGKGLEK